MLTQADYRDAIQVQDACNLSGVVLAWARLMEKVCQEANETGKGTDWKNSHPINVLFASKVCDLTKSEDFSIYSQAYKVCEEKGGKA